MLANIDRLSRRMDDLRLDGLVATTSENVYYLTGIDSVALAMFPHTAQCYAVLTRADPACPYFISGRCEVDQFLDASPTLSGAIGYGSFYRESPAGLELSLDEQRLYQIAVVGPEPPNAVAALATVLKKAGLMGGRIAVDEEGVGHTFFDAAREALPHTELVHASDLLRWTRKVKTNEEVARIAIAASVGEKGIQAAIGIARDGVTERDLVREFERTVVSADGKPKFSLIKFGRAAVGGQRLPTDTPLRRGDTIWFDVGGICSGYWFDISRVYSLGEPAAKAAKYYSAMLAGEERGFSEARPGMSGKELFNLVVEEVRAAGVPHYRRHHVGHGIGVEAYDRVLITPANEDRIEEGTVVNIETPYYEFGLGAIQVEDPFVVTAAGNKFLTNLSRQLAVIG